MNISKCTLVGAPWIFFTFACTECETKTKNNTNSIREMACVLLKGEIYRCNINSGAENQSTD